MKLYLKLALTCILFGWFGGCVEPQPSSIGNLGGSTFTGVIPCANCEGIAFKLTLKKDHQFKTSSVYIGKSNRAFSKHGSWNTRGDSILILKEGDKQVHRFKFKNEQLVMLDQKGKEISGSLAKMYTLDKADTTKNHPWQSRREQGIDYHASGYEPSWSVDIDYDSIMTFKVKKRDAINSPVLQMKSDTARKAHILTAETKLGSLKVTLYPNDCVDKMSGKVLAHTVHVRYRNKLYKGCGSFINQRYKLNDFWN